MCLHGQSGLLCVFLGQRLKSLADLRVKISIARKFARRFFRYDLIAAETVSIVLDLNLNPNETRPTEFVFPESHRKKERD